MINKVKKILVFIFFCAFLTLLFNCGVSYKKVTDEKKDNIISIKIFTSFPTITFEGKFITIRDSFFIHYYKNFIIYKLPVDHITANQKFDNEGNIIEEKILSRVMRFKYFIYKRGEKKGLFFDSLSVLKAKEIGSDSFVQKKISINSKIFFTDNDSLISQEEQENGDILEKYVRIKKEGIWGCDTSLFVFSKELKGIDFSFHKELDSLKERKLTKARFICLPDTLRPESYFRNKREILVSMEKIIVNDSVDILSLVKKVDRK